jgi:hypothetical protein
MEEFEKWWEYAIAIMLAIGARLANILVKNTERRKLGNILTELFASAIAGAIIIYGARSLGISGDAIGFLCGIAGWSGPKAIDWLTHMVAKRAGVEIKEQSNDKP